MAEWTLICPDSELELNWGEVALVNGHQYAIVKTKHGTFAYDHKDPNSGALVMARGIVGEKDGTATIASPLYKEVYRLDTGENVSGADYTLPVYPLEIRDGSVYLQV
ncbi:MAG: nitrite reductase small subunit NirD [Rothia sp. (in: high G+C Gram-positive bacteria)]|uniref:nitrite reductase small subunit NirD n=1 Tax=Rothia sp. (in: high G+C Gram-positive bacteria) TaxID=1885016 RepID=UPI0026DEC41D|nr:nitrite reductase small subunit NirD [Rothia sp. (in: high G+C Gram-positive bacteria)]MDO5751171.1 nitrite reductase small subunit NirD [Rothia sp. (in: high G+C Gram-positive bacteria)]